MHGEDLLTDLYEAIPRRDQPLHSPTVMRWLTGIGVAICPLAFTANVIIAHFIYQVERPLEGTLMVMGVVNLILIPALALVLAVVISLLPLKGRRYRKKFFPVWCWVVVLLSLVLSILSFIAISKTA